LGNFFFFASGTVSTSAVFVLLGAFAMPYVQRDNGFIMGVFENKQPGNAEEFIPEDDVEIRLFRQRMENTFGPPPAPLTAEQSRQAARDQETIELEHKALRDAIWRFNSVFNELEIALSALLHAALNMPNSHVAYAIYYSPNGFDARVEIVHNVIQQLATENKSLSDLLPLWTDLHVDLRGTPRTMRNKIAHGMPITLVVRGKQHARLTSPAFDANRVGRHMDKGQIPGLTASDIANGAKKVHWLAERTDDVNRLLSAFHKDGHSTLPEKYRALTEGLRTKGSR
jgi:hypothetical protein